MSRRKRAPTILDVAEAAGVSKSTVARVLSNSESVDEKTRERVHRASKRLGYERNRLAQALRSGRTGLLGMVIPDVSNPSWADVARGAQDAASRENASLIVLNSDWNPEQEVRHISALRQACVDGAIINPISDRLDSLTKADFHAVLIGSESERFPGLSSVGSDIPQGVSIGLEYLAHVGFTRPALIIGEPRLARTKFMRAVVDHCVARDIDPATLEMEEGAYTVESGKAAMHRLLERPRDRINCVFAANDLMAIGALLAVREAGLRCPEDISILGFDGIGPSAYSDPGLTTIRKPSQELGALAVKQLLASIDGNRETVHHLMSCTLIERGSVSARRPQLARMRG